MENSISIRAAELTTVIYKSLFIDNIPWLVFIGWAITLFIFALAKDYRYLKLLNLFVNSKKVKLKLLRYSNHVKIYNSYFDKNLYELNVPKKFDNLHWTIFAMNFLIVVLMIIGVSFYIPIIYEGIYLKMFSDFIGGYLALYAGCSIVAYISLFILIDISTPNTKFISNKIFGSLSRMLKHIVRQNVNNFFFRLADMLWNEKIMQDALDKWSARTLGDENQYDTKKFDTMKNGYLVYANRMIQLYIYQCASNLAYISYFLYGYRIFRGEYASNYTNYDLYIFYGFIVALFALNLFRGQQLWSKIKSNNIITADDITDDHDTDEIKRFIALNNELDKF